MKFFQHIIIFLVASCLLVSCEEDFVLRQNEFKPSVVVNSVFSPGKPWQVNLTFSRSRLEEGSLIKPIETAEVEVIEKFTTRVILLKHVGEGVYTSEIYPPVADRTYELVVKVPGYDIVKARSIAPNKAKVEILSDVVEKLDFEISDSKNNYYIWDLVYTNDKNELDTTSTPTPGKLVSGINKYNDLSNYIQNITTPKSNDSETTGKQTTKYIFNANLFIEEGEGQSQPIKKKYLRILTTSKDLYDYYKSVEKYNVSEHHNCSFCQAPDIKSNIINGLGIFAGYTEDFKEIK